MKTLWILLLALIALTTAMKNNMQNEMDEDMEEDDMENEMNGERRLVLNPATGQYFYRNEGNGRCDQNCQDKSKVCLFIRNRTICNSTFGLYISIQCPKACGACKSCDASTATCTDDCADARPDRCNLLAAFCNHPTYGSIVQQSCSKSCGVCLSCDGLDEVPECSDDCIDEDERQCPKWAAAPLNYCRTSSRYHRYMMANCRLSCGECQSCEGPAPPGATKKPTGRPYPTRNPYTRPTRNPYTRPTRNPYTRPTRNPYTRPTRTSYTTRRPTRRPQTTPPPGDFLCKRERLSGRSVGERCLEIHNYYRCLHGVEPLQYDSKLEQSAMAYATKLARLDYPRSSQKGNDRDQEVGENFSVLDSTQYSVNDAVTEWYAEGLGFDYIMTELDFNTDRFTQMIWADTTLVGCAVHRQNMKMYVVAHYYVEGNEQSMTFSNLFEPIRDVCSSDCKEGFCQGHDNNPQDCTCGGDPSFRGGDAPTCSGNCVVSCPAPQGFRGEWKTFCAGNSYCTCFTEQVAGVELGAYCV